MKSEERKISRILVKILILKYKKMEKHCKTFATVRKSYNKKQFGILNDSEITKTGTSFLYIFPQLFSYCPEIRTRVIN